MPSHWLNQSYSRWKVKSANQWSEKTAARLQFSVGYCSTWKQSCSWILSRLSNLKCKTLWNVKTRKVPKESCLMVARRQCTPKTSRYQSISLVFFSPIFSLPFLRKSILLLFFHPFFLFLFSDSATASLKLFARQWRGRNAGWNRVRSVTKSFRRWENNFKQSYSTTL